MGTIGERLKELRGSSSQREMAEAVGIKWNAWARYEAGGALPGADILERICRVHACSADWLLGLKDRSGSFIAGNGAAVAIGRNARASSHVTSTAPGEAPQCSRCPYKKRLEKIEKAMKA